jgi:hypothetical protein
VEEAGPSDGAASPRRERDAGFWVGAGLLVVVALALVGEIGPFGRGLWPLLLIALGVAFWRAQSEDDRSPHQPAAAARAPLEPGDGRGVPEPVRFDPPAPRPRSVGGRVTLALAAIAAGGLMRRRRGTAGRRAAVAAVAVRAARPVRTPGGGTARHRARAGRHGLPRSRSLAHPGRARAAAGGRPGGCRARVRDPAPRRPRVRRPGRRRRRRTATRRLPPRRRRGLPGPLRPRPRRRRRDPADPARGGQRGRAHPGRRRGRRP